MIDSKDLIKFIDDSIKDVENELSEADEDSGMAYVLLYSQSQGKCHILDSLKDFIENYK